MPVTWTVAAPPGVVVRVPRVRVLVAVPLAGSVTVSGLNAHDAPAGSEPQKSATSPAKSFCDVSVQALVTLLPWTTDRLDGTHATENVRPEKRNLKPL